MERGGEGLGGGWRRGGVRRVGGGRGGGVGGLLRVWSVLCRR